MLLSHWVSPTPTRFQPLQARNGYTISDVVLKIPGVALCASIFTKGHSFQTYHCETLMPKCQIPKHFRCPLGLHTIFNWNTDWFGIKLSRSLCLNDVTVSMNCVGLQCRCIRVAVINLKSLNCLNAVIQIITGCKSFLIDEPIWQSIARDSFFFTSIFTRSHSFQKYHCILSWKFSSSKALRLCKETLSTSRPET